MRIRFSIRDLLWLTLVVGMAVAWWIDHARITAQKDKFESLAEIREERMEEFRGNYLRLKKIAQKYGEKPGYEKLKKSVDVFLDDIRND